MKKMNRQPTCGLELEIVLSSSPVLFGNDSEKFNFFVKNTSSSFSGFCMPAQSILNQMIVSTILLNNKNIRTVVDKEAALDLISSMDNPYHEYGYEFVASLLTQGFIGAGDRETMVITFDDSTLALKKNKESGYVRGKTLEDHDFYFENNYGIELRFPVLDSPASMGKLYKNVISALSPIGLAPNHNCGIHYHSGVEGFYDTDALCFYFMAHVFFDDVIDDIFPEHRQPKNNRFAIHVAHHAHNYVNSRHQKQSPVDYLFDKIDILRLGYLQKYNGQERSDFNIIKKLALDIHQSLIPGVDERLFYKIDESYVNNSFEKNYIDLLNLSRAGKYMMVSPYIMTKKNPVPTLEIRSIPATLNINMLEKWMNLFHNKCCVADKVINLNIESFQGNEYLNVFYKDGQQKKFRKTLHDFLIFCESEELFTENDLEFVRNNANWQAEQNPDSVLVPAEYLNATQLDDFTYQQFADVFQNIRS